MEGKERKRRKEGSEKERKKKKKRGREGRELSMPELMHEKFCRIFFIYSLYYCGTKLTHAFHSLLEIALLSVLTAFSPGGTTGGTLAADAIPAYRLGRQNALHPRLCPRTESC